MVTLRTPRSVSRLWLTGALLGLAVVPLVAWQGHVYYAEGGRSPDAPGMLFATVLMTFPLWFGGWMAFAAPFLWRAPGAVRVLVGWGRTPLSLVLSVIAWCVSLAALGTALVEIDLARVGHWPFAVHLVGCAVYVQYLRAAAVARSEGREPR